MACSAIGLSPRTCLPHSRSMLSGYTYTRPGSSMESLSSPDSSFYRRKKGCVSEFAWFTLLNGFHLRASSSSGSRTSTCVLAYSSWGAPQKKFSKPHSCAHPHWRTEQSNFECRGRKCLSRRGLKRTFSASYQLRSAGVGDSTGSRMNQNSFGNIPLKAAPFVARKKLRCWNEVGDAGEPPPSDKAGLVALEQAIQFQVKEETRLFFSGPARGDLAEIEAFCRLYRLAEQLHATVMNALRTHSTSANLDNKALGPYNGDVLLVEEKVASGLAHLMAILHEGKADVVGVRTIGRDNLLEETSLDDLSPFARLRKEVRASCKALEVALESLLPADSEQGLAARTKMLRLKNACLDAGFPRPEGIPSPADIPNLAPVRLRPSRNARHLYKDENVAFWRGGHISETGLGWLVEKGFKTIVDLREGSAQPIAHSAVPEAVASGKLKVVRIPIERGSVPSKEQVEEFARLVADASNKPLYLHTRAGVGRASAMVSRWRDVVLRGQVDTVKKESTQGSFTSGLELLNVDDIVRISQEDALALENALYRSEDEEGNNDEVAMPIQLDHVPNSGNLVSTRDVSEIENKESLINTNGSVQHDVRNFDVTKNAFEAQRPVRNVLNKKAMTKFLRRRRVPAAFFTNKTERLVSSYSTVSESLVNGNIAGPANRWTPSLGIRMGDSPDASKQQTQTVEKAPASRNGNTRLELVSGNGALSEETIEKTEEQQDAEVGKNPGNSVREDNESRVPLGQSTPEEGDEPVNVEGDMCASTTGVVRLQSRKKAEMFLVRTDGYSCTRERVKESTLAFSHPSTQQQMLMWKTPPRTVMLLKKLGSELTNETQEVASFLHHQEGMNVMVEPEVHDQLARLPGFGFVQTFYNQDTSELHERVDFVVCLGGDGVILHASNLFRNAVPPVVSFNLGSLGFLTSHTFTDHKQDLQAVIHGHNDMMTGVYITLRMRLRCELYRNGKAIPGKVFDVLNEVVVDRGSNPYLCKIECYERNRLITKVQADGVIVATPTGSTAYSIAAGGSMVHPNVPCMLFTPICPHSLSFRPVILPDSALLELKVPRDARNNAWVSFDGKRRQQLSKGDSVRISMSEHPLPTVNKSDQTDDWFQSLVRCLNWNERLEQRPLST